MPTIKSNSKRVYRTQQSFRLNSKSPNNLMCYREEKWMHAISKGEEESSQSNDNGRFFFDDDQQHAHPFSQLVHQQLLVSKSPTPIIVSPENQ